MKLAKMLRFLSRGKVFSHKVRPKIYSSSQVLTYSSRPSCAGMGHMVAIEVALRASKQLKLQYYP